ncbi:MAG: GNAT family N-acetyltransferase [Bacteroidales bacterium]|nr:GNAT family N-acetyltransferase [Bacteroidales bacterium]
MRVLESERIILKPVEPADLPFLLEQRWDADLTEYIIHNPISSHSQQQWYEKICRNGDMALCVFYKDPNTNNATLVGTTGLYDINQRHQRATWKTLRMAKEYQGMGLSYEASEMLMDYGFRTLNLNKITCDVFPENLSVVRLLERLGFQQEGRLQQHYFHQGAFKDVVIYSLLREAFHSKNGSQK